MNEYSVKSIRKKFKEQGVFYTDGSLAELLKSYMPKDIIEVYDPTCGNGNLLSVFPDSVAKYGQELNPEQAEEARKRLVNSHIEAGDTLSNPCFMEKKFRGIVSNYPFSIKYDPATLPIFDSRFATMPCLPPASKADFLFIAHILYYLSDDGVAATLNFPGILYRGNKERDIRKWLVERNVIDSVTAIEGGHFVDTSISTALIVFKKNKSCGDIRMKDLLTGKERSVTQEEIRMEDYNLSVSSYIDLYEPKQETDIVALEKKIKEIRERRMFLEEEIEKQLASIRGLFK